MRSILQCFQEIRQFLNMTNIKIRHVVVHGRRNFAKDVSNAICIDELMHDTAALGVLHDRN